MNRLLVGLTGIAGFAALAASIISGATVHAQIAPDFVPEWQKAAGSKLSFEVASIKPGNPDKWTPANISFVGNDFMGGVNPHGHFAAQFPVADYVEFAYNVLPSRELRDAMLAHVPKWVTTDQYVINAQAAGDPTKDQMRLMTQSLLADRFKLAVHYERRETQVLALVLDKAGKTGPKLYPHSGDIPCDVAKVTSEMFVLPCGPVQAIDRPDNAILMAGRNLTIEQIAWYLNTLSSSFAHPVLDQTGLVGRFDFSLQWTRQTNNPVTLDPGTTMLEALQDQLGLKVKSMKAAMDILVIDSVERPTEN